VFTKRSYPQRASPSKSDFLRMGFAGHPAMLQ
jgi:hypothetical protein